MLESSEDLMFDLSEIQPNSPVQIKGRAQMVIDVTMSDQNISPESEILKASEIQNLDTSSYFMQSSQLNELLEPMGGQEWVCGDHQKSVEAFCDVCSEPLCIQCITLTSDHKGHTILDMNHASTKYRDFFIKSIKSKVVPTQEKIAINEENLEASREEIKLSYSTNLDKIT